ncbi:hypothetical protein COLO4_00762 [Corchorus olitorius]|uniref:Uncharacterized protein n=1 Tax=Corchorus olitorius TaxID=93759 RepID=A0A1R3L3E9_9ROSI|nr:hypothetical protein COLO4_00762 [Corchorus olitorius]
MATGLEAAWVGCIMIFTSSTVVRPPRPWAPMPSALILSQSSIRSSSSLFCGPRCLSSNISMSSISTSFAISIAFSAVPPMPMPSMPGGHQPAPMVGTVLEHPVDDRIRRVQHHELRLGFGAAPLAATITSTVSPGTSDMLITAGVLSFVLVRLPAGSASTLARSLLSTSLYARRTPSLTMSSRLIVAPSQRTFMPTFRNTVTMPVSWQIGRLPSAHMRLLRVGDALDEVFLTNDGHGGGPTYRNEKPVRQGSGRLAVRMRVRNDAVHPGHHQRRHQERHVDRHLPQDRVRVFLGRIDERLEQVDRGDADQRHRQLHLEHARVDVVQPFGLIFVALDAELGHEDVVPADDHHDQEVGDHHHVDQAQHGEHDLGFVHVAQVRNQVPHLDDEEVHIGCLGDDQPQRRIQRVQRIGRAAALSPPLHRLAWPRGPARHENARHHACQRDAVRPTRRFSQCDDAVRGSRNRQHRREHACKHRAHHQRIAQQRLRRIGGRSARRFAAAVGVENRDACHRQHHRRQRPARRLFAQHQPRQQRHCGWNRARDDARGQRRGQPHTVQHQQRETERTEEGLEEQVRPLAAGDAAHPRWLVPRCHADDGNQKAQQRKQHHRHDGDDRFTETDVAADQCHGSNQEKGVDGHDENSVETGTGRGSLAGYVALRCVP